MSPPDRASTVLDAGTSERQQAAAAGWLVETGFQPGDRLAVDCDGSPAYLAVVIAALCVGVVPVPIPTGIPAVDRRELIADAEVRACVGPDDWSAVLGHRPGPRGPLPLARPMMYTSGTTGRRKGVWSGVWQPDVARRAFLDEHDQWGFTPDDRHLVCSPLYHSAPLRFVVHTLLAGGSVLLPDRFEAERVADALAAGDVSTVFVVPAHLQRILALDPPTPSRRLRWLAHAGAPCAEDLKRRLLTWCEPKRVYEFYGSTEAQFSVCRGDEWLEAPGVVGRARRGRSLRVDADGVVWCRQPDFGRFRYWGDDAKTEAAWRDEECTVGDVGHLDESGRLTLLGRRADLIISGGANVYPAEIERVMAQHPGVDQCAAFGVADERWGQRVVFAWAGVADEQSLRDFARGHLMPAARPKQYFPTQEMPRGNLGKLNRLELADRYQRDRVRCDPRSPSIDPACCERVLAGDASCSQQNGRCGDDGET